MASSYFMNSSTYKSATQLYASGGGAIALVTGAKSGIGKALANKVATFPFIDQVFCVSRSITQSDLNGEASSAKLIPLAADVTTVEGRNKIKNVVKKACFGGEDGDSHNVRTKQLRFLIHSAGTIDPIKPVLDITPEELQFAMSVNCESPLFLTTALHPYMKPLDSRKNGTTGCGDAIAGRVLHVSSGAAHGAPPVGWSVYGITKAAFFQSYKVLERELRGTGVVVGSFKPGVVDTSMQGTIRSSPTSHMPIVANFQNMKSKADENISQITKAARPPPKGALDTPENVAYFAEWLLTGTTDEEFGNKDDPSEYDIRNELLYPKWILPENLPSENK